MSTDQPLRPEKKLHRLRHNRDFQAVYNKGRYFTSPELVLYCLPIRAEQRTRIGYTVARKLGSAVKRNHIRRRLREIVRLEAVGLPAAGYDIVVMARQTAADKPYAELRQTYLALVARFIKWHNGK